MDGLVNAAELKAYFQKASKETNGVVAVPSDADIAAMISEVDTDADGAIDFQDFLRVVKEVGS